MWNFFKAVFENSRCHEAEKTHYLIRQRLLCGLYGLTTVNSISRKHNLKALTFLAHENPQGATLFGPEVGLSGLLTIWCEEIDLVNQQCLAF